MRTDPTSPLALAVVAGGGVVGATARWAVATTWPTPAGGAGWAILAVNLTGCLLLGLLTGWASGPSARDRLLRLGLGTGVLGGFTTFSTLAVQTDRALAAGHAATGLGVLALSVVGGVALAATGMRLAARSAAGAP